MVFWRKQKNAGQQEQEAKDDKIVHHPREPELNVPEEDIGGIDPEFAHHALEPTEAEIIDDLAIIPTPAHTRIEDALEAEELKDHAAEGGWLSRLTSGLSKSTSRLGQGITDIFTKRKLDENSLQDLEDLLISADLGPKTAAKVITEFSKQKFDKDIEPFEVRNALAGIIAGTLESVTKPLEISKPADGPFVLLVCGVNGAGKTTTIGKLAHQWHIKEHRKVMIAAADTFRAAAVDQLDVWANRAHVPLFKKDIGADAAAVAFEAYAKAKEEGADILMIDTAGRLQNKSNLMAELEKIVRVLKKHDESIPHAALLVLDATTGQNAHSQVKIFKEAVNLTGLIVTKLDGSARGGVVVSLAEEFGLPIHAIGVGESIEDLSPFAARDFADALMGVAA
ncbi:MAG: signal recognition particle-docking protein FtsY [Micavibrio aeruginosavorus]|uniref:Signal recognition particle receptor FtsY n=1 Tax=Micavibrio aeruginosavorus TaxID=349221 RepID=A0A2W5MWW5_9BACT|nr:MAG: signal recognition particle-docking protein FtsY [Micavibrio aeruginosavorus]